MTKAKKKNNKKQALRINLSSINIPLGKEIQNFLKKKKIDVKPALIFLAIALGLYFLSSYLVVALVNGRPVSRFELIKILEAQNGKRTLESLITKKLILQEAKKESFKVTKEDLANEIKIIEDNLAARGQKLDEVLALQGMTRIQLEEEIEIQKIAEGLAGKNTQITEEEIDTYIEENQASIPPEAEPAEIRGTVKSQLQQQKTSEAIQTWLEKIKSEAKINYLKKY
ncbi:hypothetical protein COT75_00370 [Candidatus Beckwithbacteria bacterium CG10_big_fil_rev_8_21_14_0_10_34_10]|uniref:PpiC domain-containing protein n=1 Tax=Candidatus Beckwithbacteria bacterium CG10_big_fil_rev_8_21_14_0_10_34_10 TaxID=1974495 RepID=A0A2H0WAG4_9BACT|nr:MAG: hypothetical protein COT75_00370 [Candidatus Beckwithbacteria bacterium CG10_big_fil_rev_8_21_14_0_10_34_10]